MGTESEGGVKLILGQFPQEAAQRLREVWEEAQTQHRQLIVMPYYGERDIQVIELPRRRVPRKNISIQAHCG